MGMCRMMRCVRRPSLGRRPAVRRWYASSSPQASTTTIVNGLEVSEHWAPSRDGKHQLALKRLRLTAEQPDGERPVVLMIHGAIENGKIFCSQKMRGLGPSLARGNCDVFVADHRGRGDSRPPTKDYPDHGQTELINDDMRSLSDYVKHVTGRRKQHWVAHSWGGIICSSALARYPSYARDVVSQVWFGSKRVISVWNKDKVWMVDIIWNLLFPLLGRVCGGYVPVKALRLGAEDEPLRYIQEVMAWVKGGPWRDVDGFDFATAVNEISVYPPTWSIAAQGDPALGNPVDVLKFVEEHKRHRSAFEYTVLSTNNGNLHDYGHVSMLTHKDADRDHYPKVLAWIQEKERQSRGQKEQKE